MKTTIITIATVLATTFCHPATAQDHCNEDDSTCIKAWRQAERFHREAREELDLDQTFDRLHRRLEAEEDREHHDRRFCTGEDCRRVLWRRGYRYGR